MAGEEICLLGIIAGGALGFLIAMSLSVPARGRTKADFVVAGRTTADVLRLGGDHLAEQGMQVERRVGGLSARGGDPILGRRFLELDVRERPEGVFVSLEVHMTMAFPKEVHLGPRGFVAKIPRRQFRRVVEGLLEVLGAEAATLRHEHA